MSVIHQYFDGVPYSNSSAEVKECVELYLSSSNTPSWRGAQLKHRDNFTFYLTLLQHRNATSESYLRYSDVSGSTTFAYVMAWACRTHGEVRNNQNPLYEWTIWETWEQMEGNEKRRKFPVMKF
jgi:hypothetical protein